MLRKILSVVFIAGVLFAGYAFATDIATPSGKIGILDVQQLMTKTGYADRALHKIRKQYAPLIKSLEKDEKTLQRYIKKYNKISDNLDPAAMKEWQHKINAQQDKLQQKQSTLQEKINIAQEIETKKIIAKFFTIVSKIAEKNDLDIVLFKDITSYNSEAVYDITDEVIRISVEKPKKAKLKK